MKAFAGDRLVVRPLSAPLRDAEILEVHGNDGEPPYLVRWSDDGHEGLVFPGRDATVEHFEHHAALDNSHATDGSAVQTIEREGEGHG